VTSFLKKLQKQPRYIKKIILWSIVLIVGLVLLIWWIHSSAQKFREFKKEEFIEEINLPSFEEELKEFPKIEIPESLKKELEEK